MLNLILSYKVRPIGKYYVTISLNYCLNNIPNNNLNSSYFENYFLDLKRNCGNYFSLLENYHDLLT